MDALLTDTQSTGGYDFAMNENQQMVGQMAKDFAERYIKPHVMEWDEAQHSLSTYLNNWVSLA
jgi:hypothetical protein